MSNAYGHPSGAGVWVATGYFTTSILKIASFWWRPLGGARPPTYCATDNSARSRKCGRRCLDGLPSRNVQRVATQIAKSSPLHRHDILVSHDRPTALSFTLYSPNSQSADRTSREPIRLIVMRQISVVAVHRLIDFKGQIGFVRSNLGTATNALAAVIRVVHSRLRCAAASFIA